MQEQIHPLAIVEPGAKIGKGVVIEAFAVVKKDVVLHDDVTICSHAYISGHTTIGEGTKIWPSASIGTQPHHPSFVNIGKQCEIREFVTIDASVEDSCIEIGDHCLIMASCHVSSHCKIGSQVIMSNGVILEENVLVGDYAVIGGMTGVHQFSRIGAHTMVGGMSEVTRDVPPYSIGRGTPYIVGGVNRVGLTRRDFPLDVRVNLTKAFRMIYRSDLSVQEALEKVKSEIPSSPEIEYLLNFCESSQVGLIGKKIEKNSLIEEVSIA